AISSSRPAPNARMVASGNTTMRAPRAAASATRSRTWRRLSCGSRPDRIWAAAMRTAGLLVGCGGLLDGTLPAAAGYAPWMSSTRTLGGKSATCRGPNPPVGRCDTGWAGQSGCSVLVVAPVAVVSLVAGLPDHHGGGAGHVHQL